MTAPAVRPDRPRRKNHSVIPGFGLTLGLTTVWLSLIVLVPLSTVFVRSAGMGLDSFMEAAFSPRSLAAYAVSFGTSFIAALVNATFGLLTAWFRLDPWYGGIRLVERQGKALLVKDSEGLQIVRGELP
ncbi:MAG: hypothetical protein PHE36_14200 [Novosphingobium sp.]|nr:hypothetical protein [Novosphingobium sp.]